MKEIGIRIALGATPGREIGLVLWTGWKPILVGICSGTIATLFAAAAVARIFKGTPAQIDPLDPIAYLAVAAVLGTAATIAMLAPCYRAKSAEPALALRAE
jgi:ABC-type lipoprotein release transport system permease subunit